MVAAIHEEGSTGSICQHAPGTRVAQMRCFLMKAEPFSDILKRPNAGLLVNTVSEMGSESLQSCQVKM